MIVLYNGCCNYNEINITVEAGAVSRCQSYKLRTHVTPQLLRGYRPFADCAMILNI